MQHILSHIAQIAEGNFRMTAIRQSQNLRFEGSYMLDGEPFPFYFSHAECLNTLKRLQYITGSIHNGHTLTVSFLQEHPTAWDDLQTVWEPYDEFFSRFLNHVRDLPNFGEQVLKDIASGAISRRAFYTGSRFNVTGFNGLPWFGKLIYYGANTPPFSTIEVAAFFSKIQQKSYARNTL